MGDDLKHAITWIPSEPGPAAFEMMVSDADVDFCDELAGVHPELASLLAEHRQDDDETLPHAPRPTPRSPDHGSTHEPMMRVGGSNDIARHLGRMTLRR
jgi:hypothetical protein